MADSKSGPVASNFKVGDKVRVRAGVRDPDYPELPFGGWSGTITEVVWHDGKVHCVFRLDDRTRANLHPIFHKRSEIDGLDDRFMGLDQETLEPDDGVPAPIEQPTTIIPRPLSTDDVEDRLRLVFGLSHDDLVPEVNPENHVKFYRYLLANLTFPFKAEQWRRSRSPSQKPTRLTVTGLFDFGQYEVDESSGLVGVGKEPGGPTEFLLIELEGIEGEANRRLISDYSFWLTNF